jgi:hypothetical protein
VTGADEATTIDGQALKFGTLTLALAHTINAARRDGAGLIVGKLSKPGQWGLPQTHRSRWVVP